MLNRWLLNLNVRLATTCGLRRRARGGAAPATATATATEEAAANEAPLTDPVIPDVCGAAARLQGSSGSGAAAAAASIDPVEPELLRELAAKLPDPARAQGVCLQLAQRASAAAREVALFRRSAPCAAAMGVAGPPGVLSGRAKCSASDSSTGVLAVQHGAVTRLIWCVGLGLHCVGLPAGADSHQQGRDCYAYEIHTSHVQKLRALYRQHAGADDDWPLRLFYTRLFCLCVRYHFYLNSRNQGACPRAFFDCVRARLGVEHECFASAFNATPGESNGHLIEAPCSPSTGGSIRRLDDIHGASIRRRFVAGNRFHSAHPDLERPFGSCGRCATIPATHDRANQCTRTTTAPPPHLLCRVRAPLERSNQSSA